MGGVVIEATAKPRGNAVALEPCQLTNGAYFDGMQGTNCIGGYPQRLHWKRIQGFRLAAMRHGTKPSVVPGIRTATMTSQCNRGPNRRCGCQLRLEASGGKGIGNAPHEHLLGAMRHAKQRRTTGKVAEKGVADERACASTLVAIT
ncbi:MAG: hypothetical protein RLY21_1513 [Planctomycetota bacterium]